MSTRTNGLLAHARRMRGGPAQPVRVAACTQSAAGSGYEQAKAKLCGIESDQATVAFGPPA